MRTTTTIAAAALAAGLALAAGCGSPAKPVHLLSPAAICHKFNQQFGWYGYLDNPSPAQAALFDRYIVSDARQSADKGLAAVLLAGRHAGEAWATANTGPVDAINAYCGAYPE